MSRTWRIFVPEYVPLENKGEEAIIRGMQDVLFPEGNAEFHILDMQAAESRTVDGLRVHPGRWFYSGWRSREFGLGLSARKLVDSACSLLRNGLNVAWPGWVRVPQGPLRDTGRRMRRSREGGAPADAKGRALAEILACDFLVAGHDGALNEYDCHVIDMMRGLGMSFGVFGTSMKPNTRSRAIIDIFGATLRHARFVYCRNGIAVDWARKHFPGLPVELAPDPAFGMRPAPPEAVDRLVAAEGLESFFRRPVVMMTPAEPAPIARHSFDAVASPAGKREAHRVLLAGLVRRAVERHDVNVLFLPHAVGPGPQLDDRRIARDVLRRAGVPEDRARLLETEVPVRVLKGLIGRAEMLVAERVHSVIGAVGVGTPFLCLGSRHDTRVRGIVGDMLGAGSETHYLNDATPESASAALDDAWARRGAIRERLGGVAETLSERLAEAGKVMRERIG